MIGNLLSKADCAKCRFCCSFRRQSLWETPSFAKENLSEIKKLYPDAKFKTLPKNSVTIDLADLYKTNNAEEEVLCYFNKNGCILPDRLKPFECKIWPLRIMRKDTKTFIALATSCPTIHMRTDDEIKATIDNLLDIMRKEFSSHPEIIKEYHIGYRILLNFPKEQ